jgi:hypothetical protein
VSREEIFLFKSKLTDTAYVLAALAVCTSAAAMAFLCLYFYGVVGGPIIDNVVYTSLDWVARLFF